jgi:hypothetical protein
VALTALSCAAPGGALPEDDVATAGKADGDGEWVDLDPTEPLYSESLCAMACEAIAEGLFGGLEPGSDFCERLGYEVVRERNTPMEKELEVRVTTVESPEPQSWTVRLRRSWQVERVRPNDETDRQVLEAVAESCLNRDRHAFDFGCDDIIEVGERVVRLPSVLWEDAPEQLSGNAERESNEYARQEEQEFNDLAHEEGDTLEIETELDSGLIRIGPSDDPVGWVVRVIEQARRCRPGRRCIQNDESEGLWLVFDASFTLFDTQTWPD